MTEPLPIDPLLPQVRSELVRAGVLLLMAPPGSGKTTRVPPALLDAVSGEIVVLEPRRLAARAAAARVAEELGVQLGDLVGYQVRGERVVSRATRIRFVTEGVLVRQLVDDPFLTGTGAVLLDEFHERHIEGDLALAMLREARETVRADLRLCVMSATLDPSRLRAFLPGCAELTADGRLYPVDVRHDLRRDDGDLEVRVRAAVEQALEGTKGDVLVFLPGVGEIQRCADALHNVERRHGVAVLPLHGRLDLAAQQQAVRPGRTRKVVLSTNVAESSLTIPGVTAVVDSGLERQLRHDRGRGVDVLALERISLASATQRAGRAGRTGPGTCIRLWTAGEERGMQARSAPDVERIDLAGPLLLVRAFAGRDPREFGWFERPPEDALAAADELLHELGAVDERTRALTPMGTQMLALPVHPRLARAMIEGRRRGCALAVATAVALVSEAENLGRGQGADVLVAVHAFLQAEARGFPQHLLAEVGMAAWAARNLARTRDRILGGAPNGATDDDAAIAKCLLAGYPDRVAARAGRDSREATMVGGRGVLLPPAADGQELVLALRLMETGRQNRSMVGLTCALEESWLTEVEPEAVRTVVEARLDPDAGRVVGLREVRYRDLALRSARGGEVSVDAARTVLEPLLATDPWKWLGEQKDLRRLLARAAWLRSRMPDLGLPEWDDGAVAAAAAQLLVGTDLRALREADVGALLLAGLEPAQRQAIARQAPDRIELPSERHAVIDYAAAAGPTVSARLQEFFGVRSVPALAGGRVPVVLELLAPNHRPVQVTTDLPSFWANVYPQVRRELARRYPRHAWPEDPLAAAPQARPAPRRRS